MITDTQLAAALGGAREMRAAELKRRKESARRAYEGGEMTMREICALVGADLPTLKRWKKEGQWERRP